MLMRNVRRRGADMSQSLLYAAFALIVLVSIVALYSSLSIRQERAEASRTITAIASSLPTLKPESPAANLVSQVINAGVVSSNAVRSDVSGSVTYKSISLPYGGQIETINKSHPDDGAYIHYPGDGHMWISWSGEDATDNPRSVTNLCHYLVSGFKAEDGYPDPALKSGPLGSDYSINSYRCEGPYVYIQVSYGTTEAGFASM